MDNAQQIRLLHQPTSLLFSLQHCSEADLYAHPHPGKWSILENLAHLGRYQQMFSARMEALLQGNQPLFNPYRAEEDAAFEPWLKKIPDEVLQDMQSERIDLQYFLTNLTHDQLQLQARHAVYGLMNMEEWIEFFLLHEAHHLFTIFKLAAALRSKP